MSGSFARRLLFVVFMILPPLAVVLPVAAAPTPCADLQVAAFSISPTIPIAGQPATIHITVVNEGTCSTATSFVVQWKQSQFSATGPSTSVGPLAGYGGSQQVNLPYTFASAGNFQTQVSLDTNHAVSETNEVNNLQIYSVTVVRSTIDLSIGGFYISPNNPDQPNDVAGQGMTATAWIWIQNSGNTDAGSFQVAWKPTLMTPALTDNVTGLAAGHGQWVTFDYNYPFTGNFTSSATVDATHLVSETNEFNNSAYAPISVLPARPDLYITNVQMSPTSPVAGQNVHVTISVHNGGFVGTGAPFTVQWKPSPLALALSTQANALGANNTETVEFDYVYPNAGTFNWTATADSTHVITELSEGNNNSTSSITVLAAGINLTITGVDVSASPTQGTDTTVTVHVANNGNTDAGPFVVSWNPDAYGLIVPGVGTLTQQVNSLQAGHTTDLVFHFEYPQAGPFHTIAKVDAFNTVNETNESDNLYIKDIVVLPGNIDLVVSHFDVTPSSPKIFQQVTATIRVKNNGSLPTNGFWVQWKLSSTDTGGKLAYVPGLNPGEESGDIVLHGMYFKQGNFTTQAIVDVFNQVVEPGGEGNNVSSLPITVKPLS